MKTTSLIEEKKQEQLEKFKNSLVSLSSKFDINKQINYTSHETDAFMTALEFIMGCKLQGRLKCVISLVNIDINPLEVVTSKISWEIYEIILEQESNEDCYYFIVNDLGECLPIINENKLLINVPVTVTLLSNIISIGTQSVLPREYSVTLMMTLFGRHLKNLNIQELMRSITCMLHLNQKNTESISIIIPELYSNALEHGILGLDSDLKSTPEGFAEYYRQREDRLTKTTGGGLVIKVEKKNKQALNIEVSHNGLGFDYVSLKKTHGLKFHGRGLMLVSQYSKYFQYSKNGRSVTVSMNSEKN